MFKSTVAPQRAGVERLLDSTAVATEVAVLLNPIIPNINNSTLSNELDRSRQYDSYRTGSVAVWDPLFILFVIALLSYLDWGIISLMVGSLRKDLRISDFQIGLVQGVGFGVFYALFGLLTGYLVYKLPRRLIVYLGVTCWSFAAAACWLAQTFQQLLLARFGVGISEASLSPAAYSMIADLFSPAARLCHRRLGVGTVSGSAGYGLSIVSEKVSRGD
jgi:MFS-type transporter involved in bile tolerance (Atg22 family)